jgi:hypothetical protein
MSSRSKSAEQRDRVDGPTGPAPVLDLKAMDDGIALLSRYWQQLADMESTLETTEFNSRTSRRTRSTVDDPLD